MARQKKDLSDGKWNSIMHHIKKKVITNNPYSFVSYFIRESSDIIIKTFLFSGVIKRVGFDIGSIEQSDNDAILLECTISNDEEITGFNITTKKTNYLMEVDKHVKDGDIFTVRLASADVILKDISFSFLIKPHAKNITVKEIPFEG